MFKFNESGQEVHGQRYLRARAEISADKDGDISGQKRRYPPPKPRDGPTDKAHMGHSSANGQPTKNEKSLPISSAKIRERNESAKG